MAKKAEKVRAPRRDTQAESSTWKAGGCLLGLDLSSVGETAVGQVRIRRGLPPIPFTFEGWVTTTEIPLAARVEFDVDAAKTEEAFRAAQARFSEITLALRVSKGGHLSTPAGFLYVEIEGQSVRLGREMPRLAPVHVTNPYHLSSEDTIIVESALADITAVHPYSDPYFEVACDRFDQSYARLSPVDRFIDLIVALEALISEPEAIAYKVAVRSALLTKQTLEERRNLRGLVKGAYDRRSQVLHGKKADRRWLQENLDGIEDVVRDVIRGLLSLRRSGQSIDPAALDDLLILSPRGLSH